MVKLTINNKTLDVENGITVLQACEMAGLRYQDFVITKGYQLQETVECA